MQRLKLAGVLGAVLLLGLLAAGPALATHVDPEKVLGNPTCEDLGYDPGVKIDPPADGTYDVGDGTVEIEITGDGEFTWTSDGVVVLAVIVKGGAETPQEGPSANVYRYNPPAATTDDGLHAPHGFSHIEICFEEEAEETPAPTPGEETAAPTPGEETAAPTPGEETAAPTPGEETAAPTPGEETAAPTPSGEVLAETAPPTDVDGSGGSASSGSLVLTLLAMIGIAVAVVALAPTPASIRKRIK